MTLLERIARACLLVAVGAGCEGDKKKPPADPGSEVRRALLTAAGACAVETYRAFESAALELRDAVRAFEADEGQRAAARTAWYPANAIWQEAELMQFGPAAAPPSPGGAYLRDQIYVWPDVSRCSMEQQLVSKTYESGGLASALVGTKGLFALEYLLFHEGTENACAATAAINSTGAWSALGVDELARRKRAYARAAADDLAERARALVLAWTPEGMNFSDELARAGMGSAVFKTTHLALSAIGRGLHYLDGTVKDRKLKIPLGKDLGTCEDPPCLDRLETLFADRSSESLQRNLTGFRKIALGCSGAEAVGFDDLLIAVARPEMAETLRARVAAVESAAAAIPGPSLAPTLRTDPTPVGTVYEQVQALSDFLKTDFQSAFNLDRFGGSQMEEDRD